MSRSASQQNLFNTVPCLRLLPRHRWPPRRRCHCCCCPLGPLCRAPRLSSTMTWQCSSKSGTCHSSHTHSHTPLTRETRSLLIERHSRLRVAPPGAALLHGARSLKSSQTFSSWGGLGLGLADWSRDSSVGLAIMLRDD